MDKYIEHVVNNLNYKPDNKAFPFVNGRGAWVGSVSKSSEGEYKYCRAMIHKKVFSMAQVAWMFHYRERLSSKQIIHIDGDAFNNTIENLSRCYGFDEVTPKTVAEMFDYDPSDRQNPLVLKVDLDSKRRKGMRIGFSCGNSKYQRVAINGKRYALASLVWAYHTGEFPDPLVIDHIDHNPCNNSIDNLRAVTQAENTRNMALHKSNKSGYSGVFFNKGKRRWYAFGYEGQKQICLGSSKDKTEAIALRKQWELDRNYHPNHSMCKE